MKLDFLDNGIPVEQGQFELVKNEVAKFRKYCESLNKPASQLTERELEEYYKS